MKKALLSVVAAGLVATAVAPAALAEGHNPANSNDLTKKTYVSWRDAATEANKQVAEHAAEIKAEALRQPAVVEAAKALVAAKEIVGHNHQAEVEKAQAAYDAALADAENVVRNRYIQVLQQRYIDAAKAQGNYYEENGVEANRTDQQRIEDDIKAQGGKVTTDKDGNKVVVDKDGKTVAKFDKNGKKLPAKSAKTLPKTSAAK